MEVEMERRQSELVEQFVALAKSARGRAAVELIAHATSHPSLFAFSELLSMPHIQELENTEYESSLYLLKAFAHSTWADAKSNAAKLPELLPQQQLKLKQLTVLTLAESAKVLPYDCLMQELDIPNVRELEDFLINDCMYAGIVRGKLDQSRRCFEVNLAIGRDLKPGQLENMMQTLEDWLSKSDMLLTAIEDKIKWADSVSKMHKLHEKEVKEKVEAVRKTVKAEQEFRGHQDLSFMDSSPLVLNQERVRSKRRR